MEGIKTMIVLVCVFNASGRDGRILSSRSPYCWIRSAVRRMSIGVEGSMRILKTPISPYNVPSNKASRSFVAQLVLGHLIAKRLK